MDQCTVSNMKKRQLNISLDLDQTGASNWIYPGADGKYKLICETPDNSIKDPKVSIAPKGVWKEFDLSPRKKIFSFLDIQHEEQQQDFSYRLNIADIIRSTKDAYTPKLEPKHEEHTTCNMSLEYKKLRLVSFPKNIFQIHSRSKRLFA